MLALKTHKTTTHNCKYEVGISSSVNGNHRKSKGMNNYNKKKTHFILGRDRKGKQTDNRKKKEDQISK